MLDIWLVFLVQGSAAQLLSLFWEAGLECWWAQTRALTALAYKEFWFVFYDCFKPSANSSLCVQFLIPNPPLQMTNFWGARPGNISSDIQGFLLALYSDITPGSGRPKGMSGITRLTICKASTPPTVLLLWPLCQYSFRSPRSLCSNTTCLCL